MSANPPPIPPVTLTPALLSELRAVVGAANVLTEDADRLAYGIDGTWVERLPQVVVLPAPEGEVARVVKIAAREGIALTPRGNASGLSGGALPRAGIALALTRMNRIIEISPADQVAVVEPGIITGDLQRAVERVGLFYPPDPSSLSVSAIGGNIAENAGGARCLKYGVTGDYVMALRVVLASGAVIRTGGRTVKNVTGYNLRALFVGSEGTLGVVTQATLRLLPKPRHTLTFAAHFAEVEAAAQATTAMLLSGIIPTAIELMDRTTLDCVEDLLHLGVPTTTNTLLLVSVDGNHLDAAEADLALLADTCGAAGATTVQVARTEDEAALLWRARRSVAPALARRRPNKLGEDIAVPRSQIPAMARAVQAIAAEYHLTIPLYGHAGDGNLHPNILCDRRDAEEMARVRGAAAAIFAAAVALGGTLSGEHGIGLLKKEFLASDLGPDQIALMRAIKATIDPQGILNPGKIFPNGVADWE